MSPSPFPAPHVPAAPASAADHVKPPPRPPAPPLAPCGVGPFAPLRVRGGGAYRLRRMLRRQRRAIAAAVALAGAALATTGLGSAAAPDASAPGTAVSGTGVSGTAVPGAELSGAGGTDTAAGRSSEGLVSAPVRIADAATVRLLRPGDRVDVIAVGEAGDDARAVARGVRVSHVPGRADGDGGLRGGGDGTAGMGAAPEGALVVLSVERSAAAALLGAGASERLAVAVSDAN
ncbi:hypothetical protein [Streptomyces sp. NPDC101178]|uniref:hypothetical protein n=1 Tax=Streptomyces sp. NPDC101178 TaxID=3366124 RepID=UPI003803A6C5